MKCKTQVPLEVDIPLRDLILPGLLYLPADARGLIIFSHGSGSSRFSTRNNYVAQVLCEQGLGALLFDLLTEKEDRVYENRFDIDLLSERLVAVTDWAMREPLLNDLPISYFGASTGAASALRAAAYFGKRIASVVSRGGRPDLSGIALQQVQSPTLLLVGGLDDVVIELNRRAAGAMQCDARLEIIPGATHLFEEPGKLEEVARRSTAWFLEQLTKEKTNV